MTTSLETIFEPRCKVPTYLQTDVGIVEKCGRIGGWIGFVIITIIVILFAIKYYQNPGVKLSEPPTKEELQQQQQYRMIVIGITIVIIVLLWFGLVGLGGFFARRKWEGYNYEVEQLISQGYDRKSAIGQVQSLYQTEKQAEAIRYAGDRIGSSSRTTIGGDKFQISF